MTGIAQWIIIGFGMLLALAGLFLFVFRQDQGSNRVKLLGFEFELSKPALVIFIGGCAVVIAALWAAEKKPVQAERGGTASKEVPDKVAHEIWFQSKSVKLPLDECISRGKEALDRSDFTGIAVADEVAYGYAREYTGVVWCSPSNELLTFMVSGPDKESVKTKLTNLERGFK